MSLIIELKNRYIEEQKKLNIKTSFESLDDNFYISDIVAKNNYISTKIIRFINSRIYETYSSWGNFCHRLLMPNPASILDVRESKSITIEDRGALQLILNKIMYFSTLTAMIELKKDPIQEAQLLDEAFEYYINELKPKILPILEKINISWNDEVKEREEKFDYGGVS